MAGKIRFSRDIHDILAILISLAAIAAAYLVADRVFERVPHLEDEIAYVWQGNLMAAGELTTETPIEPGRFLVPFVVDYEGRRFGKYPLGWPALLAFGIRLGLRDFLNPLLAGLAVWLTYRLGKNTLGKTPALLAALLTVTSPFFLMNSGSLVSHSLGLVFTLGFVIAWLDAFWRKEPEGEPAGGGWLPAAVAGLALGALAVTRPFTAIGVALPFGIHGLVLLWRGTAGTRKQVIAVGLLAVLVGSLHFLWQFAATGDPLFNPYVLWWEYDKIGFGPGYGVTEQGHNLELALSNLGVSLRAGRRDLFGWGNFSWIFLPLGLWAIRKDRRALTIASVVVSLLVLYMAYWIGSWVYGPRYQYEGLFSLTLVSAAGICWLAGAASGYRTRWRAWAGAGLAALLLGSNLLFYLPDRLGGMVHLYGISRAQMDPFLKAEDLAPAVVFVRTDHWTKYGGLLELQDPFLTSPFLFTLGYSEKLEETVRSEYPDRAIYHFYPDEPDRFYLEPKNR